MKRLSETLNRWGQSRWLNAMLALVVSGLILVTAMRIRAEFPQQAVGFDWESLGLSDFRNGIYYPTMAFRDGISPFSTTAVERYQLSRPSPPYSPFLFLVHWPLTWLPVAWAGGLFYLISLGLMALLARWGMTFSKVSFRWPLFWISMILLLVSRPGHITLFTGYFTLELVVGVMLALHYGETRPWLSGIGVLLASFKPTYFLPLVIVMGARRNFRAVAWGVGLTVLGAALGIGWLAWNSSASELINEVAQTQEVHRSDTTEFPVNSWTRVDLVGLYAKWTDWVPGDRVYLVSMVALMILPGVVLWRVSRRESNSGATGPSSWIAVLAILLTVYHHSYDCLLLVVPWLGLTFFGRQTLPHLSTWGRWIVVALVAVPAGNYLSTRSFQQLMGWESGDWIWQIVTTVNGVCLTGAWVILMVHDWKVRSDHE